MAFAFFHAAPKVRGAPGLDAHVDGRQRPSTALVRPEWKVRTVRLAGDREQAADRLAEVKSASRKGRPGCEAVHILLAGPPRFNAAESWSKEKILDWAHTLSRWVLESVRKASGGHAVVRDVVLHVDEVAPHVHATIVPAVPPTEVQVKREGPGAPPTLSWKRLQAGWGGTKVKRDSMVAIQDSYALAVAPFGLERGRPDPGRRRAEPDRVKGLVERARDAEERALEERLNRDCEVRRAEDRAHAERVARDREVRRERRASVRSSTKSKRDTAHQRGRARSDMAVARAAIRRVRSQSTDRGR